VKKPRIDASRKQLRLLFGVFKMLARANSSELDSRKIEVDVLLAVVTSVATVTE
jgi:hypothetical protein